jgi:hypothetical protein
LQDCPVIPGICLSWAYTSLAISIGYPSTFLLLGSFSVLSIGIWLVFSTVLKKAAGQSKN